MKTIAHENLGHIFARADIGAALLLMACLALGGCETTRTAGFAEPPPFYQAKLIPQEDNSGAYIAQVEPAAGEEEAAKPAQISYNSCDIAPRFNEDKLAVEWGRHSLGMMPMGLRFSMSLQPTAKPSCTSTVAFY